MRGGLFAGIIITLGKAAVHCFCAGNIVFRSLGDIMNEKEMRKRLHKTIRFVAATGTFLIIIGVVVAMFLVNTMNDATIDQIQSETDEYRTRLLSQVDTDYQILNTFSSIIGNSNIVEDEKFPAMLEEANEQNDFLTMIYMAAGGYGVAATLGKGYNDDIRLEDLQDEVRPVIDDALEGRSTVSRLFVGEISEERIFAYGVPVYRKGRVIGALVASDRVEIFNEILDGEGVLGGSGYIHMINQDGEFLIRSKKSVLKEHVSTVFAAPYFTDEEEIEASKEHLKNGDSLSFSFRYDGSSYQGVIQPIGINNWCLLSINNVQNSSRFTYMMVRVVAVVFTVIIILISFLLIYGYRLVQRNQRDLRAVAYHDTLTGAYNLFHFRELVEEESEKGTEYSIISMNIHQFKFVNELFGKDQADKVLCYVCDKIRENMWESDMICRDSADIFYIFTTDTDEASLRQRARKIMDDVEQGVYQAQNDYQILMYCGVAISTTGRMKYSLNEMMSHVMFAVRKARENHQHNIWFFDTELHQREIMDNYVESHMNQALKDREFHLFLQPKITLEDGAIGGAEALVRWIKKDGEMIYPDQFVPLFEANGFCTRLDMYMVETVCARMRSWMDSGHEAVPVSVNQSKLLFYEKDYVDKLTAIVEKYDIAPEMITLEILEGMAIDNPEELDRKVRELQKRGFRVSMDDFGSGYSSLNTLGKIHINELKLDRGFLKSVTEEKSGSMKLIMEEIVQLSRKLNITTVVEGVETAENDALIRQLGCAYGQGYYYSRPVSAEEFTRLYIEKAALY